MEQEPEPVKNILGAGAGKLFFRGTRELGAGEKKPTKTEKN